MQNVNGNALMLGRVAGPPTEPRLPYSIPASTDRDAAREEPPMSAALEASLRLTASLLDQFAETATSVDGNPLLQIDLGGYHWIVSRHLQSAPDIDPRLSPRELEIVRMVALGLTNRAMASALDISPWTVSTHLRRVFSKFEVSSRAAMVARAIELGLNLGIDNVPQSDASV